MAKNPPKKRGKQSLYGTFLRTTLVPLFLFGLIIAAYSSSSLYKSLKAQTDGNLSDVAVAVLAAYDALYPGDYNVLLDGKNSELYKGDILLSGDYSFIDRLKAESNVDISIFFYDTRMLTTIENVDGQRYIYTGANPQILEDVYDGRVAHFYDNVEIGRHKYFAYYEPIFSEDGLTCLGMIGVARASEMVVSEIRRELLKNILLTLLALVVTAAFIMKFSSGIVSVIKRIMVFLQNLADGSFYTSLDPVVENRTDELGDMGRATVKVQVALRRQIERDPLTGLFNRRSGEKRLDEIRKSGVKYSLAIGDIDFFKKFNDNFGHECGDAVLKKVAETLSSMMHRSGFVVRWGGEEFLLVFENMDKLSAGLKTADILQAVRDNKVFYDGMEHSVTMTFGVSAGDPNGPVNVQINKADERLYYGKQNGRNRVVMADPEEAGSTAADAPQQAPTQNPQSIPTQQPSVPSGNVAAPSPAPAETLSQTERIDSIIDEIING